MTLPAKSCAACDVYVSASESGVSLISATVYSVKSIWVTPADVLKAERPDNGDSALMAARIHSQQRGSGTGYK